jgi:flagellar hook-associated protein 1 FlgK
MSKIWSMIDVGKRSLMNSQTGLQTVSHNIANKETEGYSRQRVEMKTNDPIGFGKTRIGTGAKTGAVTRTNNPYLEKQISNESAVLGMADGRAEALSRVEQVYNEQLNKGLNKHVGEFFNSFRELGASPESQASRTLVKETASYLAKDFQRIDKQLTEVQNDIDFQIKKHVEEINNMTREISSLNMKIQSVEMQGAEANDERDRRDLLVKKLGGLINIRYAESESGALAITAGSTAVLVSGGSYRDLEVAKTSENKNKSDGNVDIFYRESKESNPFKITEQLVGGKIGGLLDVRDKSIREYKDMTDMMAFRLATEVNELHTEGFDRYGQKGPQFFTQPLEIKGAAKKMEISKAIDEDVGKIAAGGVTNSPADNRVANLISTLQYKQVFGDGTATINEHYASMVGQLGVEVNRANGFKESQTDIVKQLSNLRESISGVSLDEETTKMIEYQKSFDASARLIRTADEMMDTVLNLKRL